MFTPYLIKLIAHPRRGLVYVAKCVLVLMLGIGTTQSVAQGTAWTRVHVGAEVLPACQFSDVSSLAFGSVLATNTLGADLLAKSSIRVRCTGNTAFKITIGGGNHVRDGFRHLAGGSSASSTWLRYSLFADAANSIEIGPEGSLVGLPSAQDGYSNVDVYGRIPANQVLYAPGLYTDTIVLTVTTQ